MTQPSEPLEIKTAVEKQTFKHYLDANPKLHGQVCIENKALVHS